MNGPVGLTLYADGPTSKSGILVKDRFDGPDVDNACEWTDLADVVQAILDGNA